ncbi:MAG: hypothetical protein QNL61_01250 [Crocinitomicaceae bacterium]
MPKIFLYPIIPAIILGTLNWIYWKRRGYTSKVQLILGIGIIYAGIYMLLKRIL